jgi:hypothetical protein
MPSNIHTSVFARIMVRETTEWVWYLGGLIYSGLSIIRLVEHYQNFGSEVITPVSYPSHQD